MQDEKRSVMMICAAVLSLSTTAPAFAGQWLSDANGWWWRNDDGSYPTASWQWLDGNGDGSAECYYFDGRGYCMLDNTTPDGYQVDRDGAWVVNGIVQRQAVSVPQQAGISESTARKLISIANSVYQSTFYSSDVRASSMSSREKSLVLWAYQYRYSGEDPRIKKASGMKYGTENRVLASDLRAIGKELFGTFTEEEFQDFCHGERRQGAYYYIDASEPGAADPYCLSKDGLSISMENGQVKISGHVGLAYAYDTPPAKTRFTAYFVPYPGAFLDGYRFERLILQ